MNARQRFRSARLALGLAASPAIALSLAAGISPRDSQPAPVHRAQVRVNEHNPVAIRHCTEQPQEVLLCQALEPAVQSRVVHARSAAPVTVVTPGEFHQYGQGEYVGRARLEHVPQYRLRVDDELEFVYRLTREETSKPYEINVGDEIRIESFADPNLDRTLIVSTLR